MLTCSTPVLGFTRYTITWSMENSSGSSIILVTTSTLDCPSNIAIRLTRESASCCEPEWGYVFLNKVNNYMITFQTISYNFYFF